MFMHREHELVVENNIMGIQFKIIKSRCLEDLGETARLDLQMEFSEIHVLFKLLLIWKLAALSLNICHVACSIFLTIFPMISATQRGWHFLSGDTESRYSYLCLCSNTSEYPQLQI